MDKKKMMCSMLALLMAFGVCMCPTPIYGATNLNQLKAPVVKTVLRLEDAKPKLTWKKVDGAAKYQVYVATSKKGKYIRKWTTVKTSYVHENAKAGVKYYYKVKALAKEEKVDDSDYSKAVPRTCGENYIVSITDTKYTYVNFKNDVNQLIKKYPDILEKEYLGKTVDNRNLYSLTLGNPDAEKQIFATAGFHAREYINCQVTMRMIEQYCRSYESGSYNGATYKEIFDDVCIVILPMVNPDGIEISAFGLEGIKDKKLRTKVKKIDRNGKYSNWKANARGVDLNGNYINYAGPPDKKTFASEGYPGPKSFSERETKAVKKALENCSNVRGVINYHSKGNVIYWGYHNEKYKERCWKFTKLFQTMTGYYPINESDSPFARGDFEHYIMHEYKIPYVCIENGKSGAPVKHSEFKTIYNKNKQGFAKAAYHYYDK